MIENKLKPYLYAALAVFVVLLGMDQYFRMMPMMEEDFPLFNDRYTIRMLLIMLFSFLFVRAFGGYDNGKKNICADGQCLTKKEIVVIGILLVISLLLQCVFASGPLNFFYLTREDGLVENASVIFWLSASAVFAWLSVQIFRKYKKFNHSLLILSVGICSALFFLGMEEASWFQRFFNFETPEKLRKLNLQGEFNVHNLATHTFEIVFFLGIFFFLVAVPYIYRGIRFRFSKKELDFFVPGFMTLWAGAMSCSFFEMMWPILFMQITFFVALFILLHYWKACRLDPRSRWLLIFMAVFVVQQVIYLIFGESFVRNYDITECKEMMAALASFVYSLEMANRFRTRKSL